VSGKNLSGHLGRQNKTPKTGKAQNLLAKAND